MANARPRISLGISSAMYVSIVTSSTPMPMPVIIRHNKICAALVWKAITIELAVYHNNE